MNKNVIKIKQPSGEIIECFGRLFSGIIDKNGREIFEGDTVNLYHGGKSVECTIVFSEGLFCLKWPDGYVNKHPLTGSRLEVINE